MQVQVLLDAVGMQIIGIVLILIIRGVSVEAVNLVVGGILVDFETLHLRMLKEGVVADHLVEALKGLDLDRGPLEGKA